jgi:hypothetical protein
MNHGQEQQLCLQQVWYSDSTTYYVEGEMTVVEKGQRIGSLISGYGAVDVRNSRTVWMQVTVILCLHVRP